MRSALLMVAWVVGVAAAPPQISRQARHWQFFDAVGQRAGILGTESGRAEAWVFPLKLLRDFRLEFRLGPQHIPGEAAARSIVSRPGSFTIIYSGDQFRVLETLIAPVDQPGALVRLEIDSQAPLEIQAHFTTDFQLMWPAAFGAAYSQWDPQLKAFRLGADGQPYAAVVGSPDAAITGEEYSTNYSASADNALSLGAVNGHARKELALAGSVRSREEAAQVYRSLIADAGAVESGAERHYERYLDRTVGLRLPDKDLEAAYDWSRLSLAKGLVDNPFLGRGLVAGFGLSRGGTRPGFGWFFGRDSCWSSLALTADGDFSLARDALEFIGKYQRDDGKIPHEISQSASLVPWFQGFPYPYASADATPLFLIAMRDYVERSGDTAFLKAEWQRLTTALAFIRSTYDTAGFPRNLGVGHGWVEGGPLLPVRTEFYQAGAAVEALRSLAALARMMNQPDLAGQLERESASKKQELEKLYWLPASGAYAFAIGEDGKPVDRPSVLATVPMWFSLTAPDHAREMIRKLSAEEFAADWGMRIISSRSPVYSPAGYHFGSVWPLFTGWASVGEYRYHAAAPALANLQANARLALDGAGNTTEVLSGAVYSPLSTSSSHQTWSAAMVVSPLLRGLFGLDIDAAARRVRLEPHLPATWSGFEITNVPLGTGRLDFRFARDGNRLTLAVTNPGAPFQLEFAPALAPPARVDSAEFNGATVSWTREDGGADWHPHFDLHARTGDNKLTLVYGGDFGVVAPAPLPLLGEPSGNLKVLSEQWHGSELELTVEGRAGRTYTISTGGGARVVSVAGAALAPDGSATLRIPGAGEGYARHTVRFTLAAR